MMLKSRLYYVWLGMKARCSTPEDSSMPRNFKNYAQRGISVCPEWINDYEAFRAWAVRSGYKVGLWIDRENGSGNYNPENCRWVTPPESARNTSHVKLRPRDVIAIRLLMSRGTNSAEIAARYAISERHVRLIARKKRWYGVRVVNN